MTPAFFPNSVWDGSSKNRSVQLDGEPPLQVFRGPDAYDWEQIVAELIAVESDLFNLPLSTSFLQLNGVAGGQSVVGGTEVNDNLVLNSTSNPAKGYVLLGSDGSFVGINTTTPSRTLEVVGAGTAARFRTTQTTSHAAFEIYASAIAANNYFTFNFQATDSLGANQTFAAVGAYIDDLTQTTRTGRLRFRVVNNGALAVYTMELTGPGHLLPASTTGTQNLGSSTNPWAGYFTTTTFSGPVIGFQDKGGQEHNVKAYGAKGDGTTDDTTAINLAISTCSGLGGGKVKIPAGTYKTTGKLIMFSNVIVEGVGANSIIQPSLTYSGGSGHGIFEFIGSGSKITHSAVRNLVIDTQGGSRTAANVISYQIILSNADYNVVEDVILRNHGYGVVGTDKPSDPCILIIAKDTVDDVGTGLAGGSAYPNAVIGSASHNTVNRCTFEGGSTAQFAVRIESDWSFRRNQLTGFTNYARNNVVSNCTFTGSYGWNTIEIAGGACHENKVRECHAIGTASAPFQTITFVDLDKGCMYNTVVGCTVAYMQKTSYYINDGVTRTAAFTDHGIPASDPSGAYYSEGNSIVDCKIISQDTPGTTDVYEAAVLLDSTVRSSIRGLHVGTVNPTAANGNGISIRECQQVSIEGGHIKGVTLGIRSDASATSRYKLQIKGIEIESTAQCILLNGATAGSGNAPKGVTIQGCTLNNTGTTLPVIYVGAEIVSPTITGNSCIGGNDGITCNTTGPVITGNTCKGNSATAIRVYFDATINGNHNDGATNDVLFSGTASSTTKLAIGVNSFTTQRVKTSAYTMLPADEMILANASGGAFAIALTDPRLLTGQFRRVMRTDNTPANAVTFTTPSGVVNNNASLTAQYGVATFYSDGTNWNKIT